MRTFLKITQKISFIISMTAGACLDSESIIFPIILLFSFSWFLTAEKLLNRK